MNINEFETALRERILLLDGAMGTMVQRRNLNEKDFCGTVFREVGRELKGNNECLNLTRPDIVSDIHNEYIAAGADIIETNTFSANTISQSEHGCGRYVRDMALEGARIARSAADGARRKVWVAGSVGPTSKSLTLPSDYMRIDYRELDFDDMAGAYSEQISALIEGGVDIIQIETCFDALNAKAAIYALSQVAPGFPVIISASVSDSNGRTLTGQTLEAFYTSVRHAPLVAFGINCSFGAASLEQAVRQLSPEVECAFCFYPNAGLPNAEGIYDDTPEKMAETVRRLACDGQVNIVGGCCGTTPEHISALAEAVNGLSPRRYGDKHMDDGRLVLSGQEKIVVDNQMIADAVRLEATDKFEEALDVAAQIPDGVSLFAVKTESDSDPEGRMASFLRFISCDPSAARAAVMVDSTDISIIRAALKNLQGRSLVHHTSQSGDEDTFLKEVSEIRNLGGETF